MDRIKKCEEKNMGKGKLMVVQHYLTLCQVASVKRMSQVRARGEQTDREVSLPKFLVLHICCHQNGLKMHDSLLPPLPHPRLGHKNSKTAFVLCVSHMSKIIWCTTFPQKLRYKIYGLCNDRS